MVGARDLGQPEVHDFHATRCYEKVGRLYVAMHDASRVRGVQRIRDLDGLFQYFADFQRTRGDTITQGLSDQTFHH